MPHFYKTIIRTMASKKATLSSKLAKQVKPEKPTVKTELWVSTQNYF